MKSEITNKKCQRFELDRSNKKIKKIPMII